MITLLAARNTVGLSCEKWCVGLSRSLDDYADIVGYNVISEIERVSASLRGIRVLHINSTKYGGGVAEVLNSMVPLMRSVGIDVRWEVLKGDASFFEITKTIHNALQGNMSVSISAEQLEHYVDVVLSNSDVLSGGPDIVVIHDPQPLPLVELKDVIGGKWIWRCHIDLSSPNMRVWDIIRKWVMKFDAVIFTLKEFMHEDFSSEGVRTYFIPPSIDPLSDKNRELSVEEVLNVLEAFDVDPNRPVIGQVARFDPWKDPIGVVDTYWLVKEKIPDVQLVIIGSFANDDPEGREWWKKTVDYVGGDPDAHVLTDLDGVGAREVNAFQRAMSVAMQLSIREGFGLAVSEALWKGVPVVARGSGGIKLQVIDGVTGYLIDDVAEAADKITYLLRRAWISRVLGVNGREHVRKNFLITTYLLRYLRIFSELLKPKH